MATTNMDTVTAFFKVFASTPANSDIDNLVDTYFSASASLGISPGGDTQQGPQLGPQFPTPAGVKTAFKQIVASFPHATFAPFPLPPATAVYCSNGNTIIVQAQLNTGKHIKPWFPFGSDPYSKPLSDIEPDKTQFAFVPACAVFTFDNAQKILNLAIYMDRWQMAVDLWPGVGTGKKPGRHFPTP
jgi:hypothetical protein